ncbi:MAG: hypothetical protein NT144_00985 [Bacteroidia bacterium]|nr:hypothetical protein [Bacteroidia bacterium]
MKVFNQILILALLTLGSCTSNLYTGAEYDDLYYLPSDKPVINAKQSVNEQLAEGTLTAGDYYDNIYAADTLVSEQYSDALGNNDAIIINNNNYDGGYDYSNNYSYTGRLRRFYGNYFDPYWRDPFYSDWGYPSFGYGFGYGGFQNYYNPFSWNPYFGYGGLYSDYYGGGYYGGGYGGGYYGGGYYGGYYTLYKEGENSVPYGRRERPSALSSRWNNNVTASGSSRRDSYLSTGGNYGVARRTPSGTQTISADQRRPVSSNVNPQQSINPTDRKLSQDPVKGENMRTNTVTQRSSTNVKPEYNSVNRTYTPSYSNPRMSTRPSYNNSRVSDGATSGVTRNSGSDNNSRVYNNADAVRTPSNQNSSLNTDNSVKSNSSVISVERRAVLPSNNSVQYSVPTRRSAESSSGYSSGSYNNSSSGSRSSSSYSSGSSGSESRSSYSSGSSSSGSSSSSSSGSSSRSSSGRR